MKISNINNTNYNNLQKIRYNNVVPNLKVMEQQSEKQKVFASNMCFKSVAPTVSLYNDYKWFINHDKVPAINSLLKIVAPAENFEKLLNMILANKKDCFELFDSIVDQPRENNNFYNQLKSKLPSNSTTGLIFIEDNPIRLAYKDYIKHRYENASSIQELLKVRPDWSEEALFNVHQRYQNNKGITLGEIPNDIGKENLPSIIYHLKNYHQYGFKSTQRIDDLTVNNRTFKFKSIIDGKSEKNVYEMELENSKKYIIKISPKEQASFEEDSALGTSSKVDYYLTEHKCRNNAPFKYYDHENNVAIYDYINHLDIPRFTGINESSDRMPDYTALCLKNCDNIGCNNFFILDSNQEALKDAYNFKEGVKNGNEIISVDNDIVEYHNPLQPSIGWPLKALPGINYLMRKLGH